MSKEIYELRYKLSKDQLLQFLTITTAELQAAFSNPYTVKGEQIAANYEGHTESHEQLFFFACELGTADEGECGGRWNQLLCYP